MYRYEGQAAREKETNVPVCAVVIVAVGGGSGRGLGLLLLLELFCLLVRHVERQMSRRTMRLEGDSDKRWQHGRAEADLYGARGVARLWRAELRPRGGPGLLWSLPSPPCICPRLRLPRFVCACGFVEMSFIHSLRFGPFSTGYRARRSQQVNTPGARLTSFIYL